jgi:hypothetical protein
LSSRNLLYLEAEVLDLQKQQDDLDFRDSRRDPDVQQCLRSWTKLRTSGDPDQVKRMELIEKIREKLKEYRKSSESDARCFFHLILLGILILRQKKLWSCNKQS